jgi:hypothetical protein
MRDLDSIVAQDNARRAMQADELIKLASAYYGAPDSYHVSRGITGEPSEANRQHRASDDCWNRGMRGKTFGVAHKGAAAHTVKVTRDGVTTIKDARSYREVAIATKQRKHRAASAADNRRALMNTLPSIHS